MPRAAGEAKPRRSRLFWVGLPVFAVFAVFGGIVWLAYQDNARVPTGEPPLIRASTTPYKLAPDDPGGREVADQGEINDLLRDEPRPAQPERVLPLPEEPRAPVLGAAPAAEGGAASAARGEPLPPGASSPGPVDAVQEAEAALGRLLADVGPAQSPGQPAVEQSAAPTPDPAAIAPAMRPAAPPSATPPTTVRAESPQVAAPVDAPSQEADAALARLLAEVAGEPTETADEPTETADELPAPARPPGAVAAMAPVAPIGARAMGPGFRVQLAAVREQDDVERAWADLVNRLGSLIADHEPYYERAETANGVFYRIQLGPFTNEEVADRLCTEVQQRNASCFVVIP
jgi:hypothetical protein